jgi:hypothetical protein
MASGKLPAGQYTTKKFGDTGFHSKDVYEFGTGFRPIGPQPEEKSDNLSTASPVKYLSSQVCYTDDHRGLPTSSSLLPTHAGSSMLDQQRALGEKSYFHIRALRLCGVLCTNNCNIQFLQAT